jgi:hypothetical protein
MPENDGIFVNTKAALDAFRPRSKAVFYRLVAAGKIRSVTNEQHGRKEKTFSLEDIKQAKRNNIAAPTSSQAVATLPREISFPATALDKPDAPTLLQREIWRISEAATATGLPESFLLRYVKSGHIRAIKAGAWLLPRQPLIDWIRAGMPDILS